MLDLPQVSGVRHLKLDPSGDGASLTAERVTDEGYDVVRCALPALITVTRMLRRRYTRGGRNGKRRKKSPW